MRPELQFTGGERGWVGDNPFIFLDSTKVRQTGWASKLTIREGITATLRWLEQNRWVLEVNADSLATFWQDGEYWLGYARLYDAGYQPGRSQGASAR